MGESGSIWRNPKFTIYAIGTLFNSLGNAFFDLAVPLIIYNLTHSFALMGIMAVSLQLPKIVLGPMIGTFVDWFNPKKVIFRSYQVQIFLVLLIPLLYYLGLLSASPWLIVLIGFLLNSVNLFARSSNFVLIPVLYPDQKVEANAGFSSVWTSSMLTGPVIGGFMLTFMSPSGLIIIDSLTFVIMIICLVFVNIPDSARNPVSPRKEFMHDMLDGARMAFASKNLRLFLISIVLFTFAIDPITTLVIYQLKEVYHFTDSSVGFVSSAAGLGLFSGTLIARLLKKEIRNVIKFGYYFLIAGTAMLLLPGWHMMPVGLFLVNCGGMIYIVGRSALIQTFCPQNFLARVNSAFQLVEQAGMPLSIFVVIKISGTYGGNIAFRTLLAASLASLIMFFISGISSEKVLNFDLFKRPNEQDTLRSES